MATNGNELSKEQQEILKRKKEIAEESRALATSGEKRLGLQKGVNQQRSSEQQAMRDQIKKIKDEERREKVRKGEYWTNLEKKAQEYSEPGGQFAYVQWNTNMMNILGIQYMVAKALHHDDAHIRGLKYVFWDSRAGVFARQLATGAKEWVKEKVSTPPVPQLEYSVTVNDKGQLTTEATRDGIPLPDELQKEFDIGVVAWLNNRGYKFSPDPDDPTNYIVTAENDPNQRLTPALLKQLDADDDYGLNAFFQGRFQVELEAQQRSTPSM